MLFLAYYIGLISRYSKISSTKAQYELFGVVRGEFEINDVSPGKGNEYIIFFLRKVDLSKDLTLSQLNQGFTMEELDKKANIKKESTPTFIAKGPNNTIILVFRHKKIYTAKFLPPKGIKVIQKPGTEIVTKEKIEKEVLKELLKRFPAIPWEDLII